MSAIARSSMRSLRIAAPLSHVSRRTASNVPPVGSGPADPQTTTTSSRVGPARVDQRSGGGPLPYLLAIGILGAGAYFYLQEDPSAKAKVKSEAQSAEDKAKDLYNKAKSETKSVFGQAESDAKGYRREAENRGQDILDSAKARATDAKKDAEEGWFKFKNKAGEVADDAKDAFDKAGNRIRGDVGKAEDRSRSLFNDARSQADSKTSEARGWLNRGAAKAENAVDGKPWWAFGSLPSKGGDRIRSEYEQFKDGISSKVSAAGDRLRKDVDQFKREGDRAENKASSWFTSAKEDAKSKL